MMSRRWKKTSMSWDLSVEYPQTRDTQRYAYNLETKRKVFRATRIKENDRSMFHPFPNPEPVPCCASHLLGPTGAPKPPPEAYREPHVPWSINSLYWGWSFHPLIRNPYNGYINPYYWVVNPQTLLGINYI